ncbi:outer membrane protein assembly factor BamC [Vibrio sinensis]|uniref:Outer membrane protein assembly factor BamC n=1 Tax=Vibrio sinensis TaxID=2302434 RepID=A0A3A6QYI7_9VIBR|nr:outer membrane protein assembly factor BamC [Vibrio sinensis]RJX68488.1 outer membrane protein assembly factor BamC [Vibrio sinensis]
MKLTHQLVVSSLAVFVLSACSGDASQRRQAKNDFEYLNTAPLMEWKELEGSTPQFYQNYNIPIGDYKGGVGNKVDIRPPQQVLALIPGARTEVRDGEVTIWLIQPTEQAKVWDTAKSMIDSNNIGLTKQSDNELETDWVNWTSEDEDVTIEARYKLSRVEANNRHGVQVTLIDWRKGGQDVAVTATENERYTVLVTNLITARYDTDLRAEAAKKAQELVKHIPISMGSDRSGLPVIIARTPYDVLWQRLPTILPEMGFTLEELNQSQGTVKAKYAAPDDEFWQEIGVKPLELKSGTYTFLFGDLGNRTSINVTDSKGKPVEEALLKDMAPVLSAVAEK